MSFHDVLQRLRGATEERQYGVDRGAKLVRSADLDELLSQFNRLDYGMRLDYGEAKELRVRVDALQAANFRLRAALRSLYNELIARPASSRSKRCQSAVDAAAAELFEPDGKVKG